MIDPPTYAQQHQQEQPTVAHGGLMCLLQIDKTPFAASYMLKAMRPNYNLLDFLVSVYLG